MLTLENFYSRISLYIVISFALFSINLGQLVLGEDSSGSDPPQEQTVSEQNDSTQTNNTSQTSATATSQNNSTLVDSTSLESPLQNSSSLEIQIENNTFIVLEDTWNCTSASTDSDSAMSSIIQNVTFSDAGLAESNSTLVEEAANTQNNTLSIISEVPLNSSSMQSLTVYTANCSAQYLGNSTLNMTDQNMSFNSSIPINYTNVSHANVKFDSIDPDGNQMSGQYHIRKLDESTFSTGLTPTTFSIESEVPYVITARDSDTHSFDHWADTGSTNKKRQVIAEEGDRFIRIKAVYVEVPPLPPDFVISPGKESLIAEAGGVNARASLTLSSMLEFNSAVGLNASTGVPGLFANLSAISVDVFSEKSGISILTISAAPDVLPGKYAVTIVATSGSIVHSKTIPVLVFAIPKG